MRAFPLVVLVLDLIPPGGLAAEQSHECKVVRNPLKLVAQVGESRLWQLHGGDDAAGWSGWAQRAALAVGPSTISQHGLLSAHDRGQAQGLLVMVFCSLISASVCLASTMCYIVTLCYYVRCAGQGSLGLWYAASKGQFYDKASVQSSKTF